MDLRTDHEYRESDLFRDVCGHRDPDTGQMCGAPEVHPWHGHHKHRRTFAAEQRRKHRRGSGGRPPVRPRW